MPTLYFHIISLEMHLRLVAAETWNDSILKL